MFYVFFTCSDPNGDIQENCYGYDRIETCFNALNGLVASGWQLYEIGLRDDVGKQVLLPVEAFDGDPAMHISLLLLDLQLRLLVGTKSE